MTLYGSSICYNDSGASNLEQQDGRGLNAISIFHLELAIKLY